MWPFQRNRDPDAGRIDPADGDPTARALAGFMRAGDWRGVRDILAEATEPDTRACLLESAVEAGGAGDWIGGWARAEPDSTLPGLVRGCHATRDDPAAAERILGDVVRRDPDEVTARTWLLISGRRLGIGADEARDRFDQVVRRWPGHLIGYEQRMRYLSLRACGTGRQMFAFAREAMLKAKPGSLLPGLLPLAHLEQAATMTAGAARDYLHEATVRADLLTAAGHSLFHPDFAPAIGWTRRANVFAAAFHLAGEHHAAARVFDLIGDRVSARPWIFFDPTDPVRLFTGARTEAYNRRF
ncbi:hypothetical protein [Paractinoplanes rishiriensis]|uniref:Tetratricopeptide repeat protein n=1 Tax=Paractinoplanes rishiriensis TaxID=1050105 RepID=A0A919N1L1_9ACTN|nr:hypothetical protein [Actinoplanes rishiriensis]GIE97207.1 hypothetical protein Ari01nite_46720 [Actinoplanes rishiriensis]